jgi:hypothetical protein
VIVALGLAAGGALVVVGGAVIRSRWWAVGFVIVALVAVISAVVAWFRLRPKLGTED